MNALAELHPFLPVRAAASAVCGARAPRRAACGIDLCVGGAYRFAVDERGSVQ